MVEWPTMKLFHVLYRQQCVNEHEQVAQRDSFNCVFFQVRLTCPLRLDDLTNLVGGWWVGMVEDFKVLPFKMRLLPIKMEFEIRKELLYYSNYTGIPGCFIFAFGPVLGSFLRCMLETVHRKTSQKPEPIPFKHLEARV